MHLSGHALDLGLTPNWAGHLARHNNKTIMKRYKTKKSTIHDDRSDLVRTMKGNVKQRDTAWVHDACMSALIFYASDLALGKSFVDVCIILDLVGESTTGRAFSS